MIDGCGIKIVKNKFRSKGLAVGVDRWMILSVYKEGT